MKKDEERWRQKKKEIRACESNLMKIKQKKRVG